MTTAHKAAPLDIMLMAGKGTPSEESVPLVCPDCRDKARYSKSTPNAARCWRCNRTGFASDWLLIEQLRRYVGRMIGHDALASHS